MTTIFKIMHYCINRNIVECKVLRLSELLWDVWSINRNIVECKDCFFFSRRSGSSGINRNIVECKAFCLYHPPSRVLLVLIETLWNVKIVPSGKPGNSAIVLIETLWNVKQFSYLQCKFCKNVLIETLWNVKVFQSFRKRRGVLCINRNIVECKVSRM